MFVCSNLLVAVQITFGGWGLEDAPRDKAQILGFISGMNMLPGYKLPPWIADMFDILCDESVEEPIIGFYPYCRSEFTKFVAILTFAAH